MNERQKMLSGKLYQAGVPELVKERETCQILIERYNSTSSLNVKDRAAIIKSLFNRIGANFTICKPFYCDYGSNIVIGDNFYANFDCIILDVARVIIGNNVLFGPRVCVFTAGHPVDKCIRNQGYEFGKEVHIGNDVWIGGNSIINPGVTIGDNVIIGSGSVVTKNIPSNSIAVGNPCKVLREINEKDFEYWSNEKELSHKL